MVTTMMVHSLYGNYAGTGHQLATARWNRLEQARAVGEGLFQSVTARRRGGANLRDETRAGGERRGP
jgi:hypothetical protein